MGASRFYMSFAALYKIQSPSGGVYIGQSRNITERWKYHRRLAGRLTVLKHSLKKYGSVNHEFSILVTLPQDITQPDLNRLELFYITQYRDCGFKMLNSSEVTIGGSPTEETLKKLSTSHKGNLGFWTGKKLSDDHRKKLSEARRKYTHSAETYKKSADKNRGKKRSEETKQKMRIALKGKAGYKKGTRICSEETKEKIRQTLLKRNDKYSNQNERKA